MGAEFTAPEQPKLSAPVPLPLAHSLSAVTATSLLVAVVLAIAASVGLLNQSTIYPTEELRESFVANDVVNLLIGLPVLLSSILLARRGRLLWLLFWPGALLFVFYNSVAYTFALPANLGFLLNLLLLVLSAYTMIALVAAVDAQAIRQRLAGAVSERLAGGVLVTLGALFFLRALVVLGQALLAQTPLGMTERAVNVADAITAPAWVIGGLLLWRRRQLGYVAGLGLLFQASMLFVGAIAFLLLQPLLTAAPLGVGDIVVLAIMGLVCFVPFALFARGVASKR